MIIWRRKSEMTFSKHLHINHPVIRPAFHYQPPHDRCFPKRLWSITSSQLTQCGLVEKQRDLWARTWRYRWPRQWGWGSKQTLHKKKKSVQRITFMDSVNNSLLQEMKKTILLQYLCCILLEWLFLILLRSLPTNPTGLIFSPMLQAKMLTYLEQQPVRGTD